jgi:RNA polymerase sigma factor (sigma-70 family)
MAGNRLPVHCNVMKAKVTPRAVRTDDPIYKRARIVADQERVPADGGTAIKLYLREIGKVKPLTPQAEIELAARIKKGDKEAREQMVKANLRLVTKIARDYEGMGLPLLDLISEGNIGLMKAVEQFDPAKGGTLSTCSSWWIKQSIKRALANGHLVTAQAGGKYPAVNPVLARTVSLPMIKCHEKEQNCARWRARRRTTAIRGEFAPPHSRG